ncbi:winged helix-turn-helix transcriptional regulator [Aliihoeflea aestuarii]|jgi:Lrp/AsnC family transcriptional regulator, regulator of ectoine-degradation genes|uniref:Lrp/AsnC family transcriptional regulator n=1 Tax=Aliihoeflea aestuarii TaxID=453840 RepID=UPI002095C22E|nr:Lrp/AsnC family transcriptional regulator [Aliihoeflea aestuarii]MCO6392998.1 winged helix-turn-helix transcriptional regulator [Aliihoeflea aestuarii]
MLKLDDRDLAMLAILREEGRLSKAELAKRINLSAAPCWERLKRLEDAGIIVGYRAEVALKKIAAHIVVFMAVELEQHRTEDFALFERAIAPLDEIVACWAVGGGFDYILQIVTRDIDSYQRLVDHLLEGRTGLARYFTYVVTKPVKQSARLPFDLLLGREE